MAKYLEETDRILLLIAYYTMYSSLLCLFIVEEIESNYKKNNIMSTRRITDIEPHLLRDAL